MSSASTPSHGPGDQHSAPQPPLSRIRKTELAVRAVQGLLLGAIDSVNVFPFVMYCIRSPKIVFTMKDCIVLNMLLSISVWVVAQVFSFLPINAVGLFAQLCKSLLAVFWVLPMYALSQLLGLRWYEELYRSASQLRRESQGGSAPNQPLPTFSFISEALLKAFVTLIFGLVAVALGFVPWIGPPLSFVLSSWLHAFYCFDYRLMDQRKFDPKKGTREPLRLTEMLLLFELRSTYFLGFGATHIAIRTFLLEGYLGLSTFVSLPICTVLYAFNVVMTVDANPSPQLPVRVPMFAWSYLATLQLFPSVRASKANRAVRATQHTPVGDPRKADAEPDDVE